MKFKAQSSEEDRKEESRRILEKYPERVPCIVELSDSNKSDLPEVDKKKYLVPRDLTCGQFMYVIRKRLKLSAEVSIFLYVDGGNVPATAALISQVYDEHKDPDGFLYMTYGGESVFGRNN
eukprot:GSChrysophyteH1.ASY1.ANO1.3351.1 assembled CDS